MRDAALLFLLLATSCWSSPATPKHEPSTVLSWARSGPHAFEMLLDGRPVGELQPDGEGGLRLTSPNVAAELTVEETPVTTHHSYPRRVRIEGRMDSHSAIFRNEYLLLAPPAPLPIEGYGLVVEADAPGTNEREHAALLEWLATRGLPADTRHFERLHEGETGRELRVWYEISGRRIEGRFDRLGSPASIARVDSLFRSKDGALKIHHKRPGENGRFDYHRESLELADAIAASGEDELIAHQCGCYGYAIAGDFMTLGRSLYHVEADWLDDRVAAELFIGFERRPAFPWIGLGDRLHMRNLARRARAFVLTDASGERFAELALELPDDPPPSGLGPITYRVDQWSAEGLRQPLARIEHQPNGIRLVLPGPGEQFEAMLQQLDRLLAAMPVQVMRGDGVRDSHLLEIELLVDAVRLLEWPNEERLADLVSDVDAASAARKVGALLAQGDRRFAATADGLPPTPIPGKGPGRAGFQAGTRAAE